jgi:hypothetical protein
MGRVGGRGVNINDILEAIKIEMNEAEEGMEGADSDDFLFCGEKLSMLHRLGQELNMILFSSSNKGRTSEELISMLRGRVDAIHTVIDLIRKPEREIVE